jgi:hypothetical protein
MFKVQNTKKYIQIETGNAVYEWNALRGGLLTNLIVKDEKNKNG